MSPQSMTTLFVILGLILVVAWAYLPQFMGW